MKRSLATEGATLIYTSLLVMMLVAMTLVVTSQIALRSRSSSQEQDQLLVAQYAAEAGIARGQNQLAQVRGALGAISLDQTLTDQQLGEKLAGFCGVTPGHLSPFATTILAQPLTVCQAATSSSAATTLASWVPPGATPTGWTAATWSQLFSESGYALPAVSVNGATVNVTTRLTAVDVQQTAPSAFHLRLRVSAVHSTGQSGPARRVLSASSDGLFVLTFTRPAFSAFAQFRNLTTSTSGGGLSFGNGEIFRGPVHTNDTLRLSGTPRFYGALSTAGVATSYSGLPCSRTVLDSGTCTSMFPDGGAPKYNTGAIALPTNNNNQLRAALGLPDTSNTAPVSSSELQAALGLSTLGDGVFMSKPSAPNTLFGGLYVKGPAAIVLSTTGTPTRQIIEITQTIAGVPRRTRMVEGTDGRWTRQLYDNGTLTSTTLMQGAFNGVLYVDGAVDLYGDGTANPDVGENTAMTISVANGDMRLKSSVTYAQNPLLQPTAKNVLGLFNATGSILLDGPYNQDMDVNATILASATSKGFGTVNPGNMRGDIQPRVNLIGGVIENQSQTVSSAPGGYRRNYNYDPRFSKGYSPPYFPLQQRWTTSTTLSFDIGVLKQGR